MKTAKNPKLATVPIIVGSLEALGFQRIYASAIFEGEKIDVWMWRNKHGELLTEGIPLAPPDDDEA